MPQEKIEVPYATFGVEIDHSRIGKRLPPCCAGLPTLFQEQLGTEASLKKVRRIGLRNRTLLGRYSIRGIFIFAKRSDFTYLCIYRVMVIQSLLILVGKCWTSQAALTSRNRVDAIGTPTVLSKLRYARNSAVSSDEPDQSHC